MSFAGTSVYSFLFFSFFLKAMKNEIKRRQSKWKSVHWELVEPAISIRTLRARMVSYLLFSLILTLEADFFFPTCTCVCCIVTIEPSQLVIG
jgi:hypothetical protein